MSKLQKTAATVLIVLLAAAGYGLWTTHAPPVTSVQHLRTSASAPAAAASALPVIDENTLLTAQRLARLANTPEERSLAQSAVQIADHELDLAFTAALWHLEAHPPPLSAEASQIQERLSEAQNLLASEAESVRQLTEELARASDPDKPAIQDRLDLAQSRMDLAQDEVQEANDDLLQAGGNVHQRIQQMQQEHQAAVHTDTSAASPPAGALGSLRSSRSRRAPHSSPLSGSSSLPTLRPARRAFPSSPRAHKTVRSHRPRSQRREALAQILRASPLLRPDRPRRAADPQPHAPPLPPPPPHPPRRSVLRACSA